MQGKRNKKNPKQEASLPTKRKKITLNLLVSLEKKRNNSRTLVADLLLCRECIAPSCLVLKTMGQTEMLVQRRICLLSIVFLVP